MITCLPLASGSGADIFSKYLQVDPSAMLRFYF